MTAQERKQLAVIVLLYACISAAYSAVLWLGSRAFRASWFASEPVGGNPPWYFIGQDVAPGPYALATVAILSAAVVAARPHAGPHAWAVLASVPLSFAGLLATASNVLLHTTSPWNPQIAKTTWATFEQFLASQAIAHRVGLAAGGLISVLCIVQYVRALRAVRSARLQQDAREAL